MERYESAAGEYLSSLELCNAVLKRGTCGAERLGRPEHSGKETQECIR